MIYLSPRVSEKAYALALDDVYVFDVSKDANKAQIADLVERKYNVKVKEVRTVLYKGKSISSSRGKRRSPIVAKRPDTKRAYVTLTEGAISEIKDAITERDKE
jgi:large subunit ribosomal protein L23